MSRSEARAPSPASKVPSVHFADVTDDDIDSGDEDGGASGDEADDEPEQYEVQRAVGVHKLVCDRARWGVECG